MARERALPTPRRKARIEAWKEQPIEKSKLTLHE